MVTVALGEYPDDPSLDSRAHPAPGSGVASCTGVQAYRDAMSTFPGGGGWVPGACTLPTMERPIRVAEFDRFFAESVRGVHRPDPARLELAIDPAAEAVARDLAGRESGCCAFFRFGFASRGTGVLMEVEVPGAYADVLDAFAARVATVIGGRG